ncbi:MAG: M48 family peptidase [Sulfurospirillum sp.]|nr:MAG: M48 family peptidase [Sulfurospirillum sp.]
MLLTIGIVYFIYILIKVYVSVMEIGYVSRAKHDTPVILLPSNYVKAAEYKVKSQRMSILSDLIDYAMFIFWIGYGLKWLDMTIQIDDIALKSVVYILSFLAINYIVSLPFSIYSNFYLDKKFGFSTITPKLFIQDQLKAVLLTAVFGGVVVWIIANIIIHIQNWWLVGFVVVFAIVVIINMIYPTFIAPLFNKFKLLEDDDLKTSIENLLKDAGLISEGVYTIDASKRDNRLNAYFGGLGKSKRVVLFDTLIQKLQKNELLAVLGHELGHFKHKDILKNIALVGGLLFLMFAIFGNLPQELFNAIGVSNTPYSTIALFLLFSPVVSFFYMPLMGAVSRHNEYRADEYGSQVQSKEVLASALKKLANENKSFPKSSTVFKLFYYTHPPLIDRLKALGEKIDEN